MRDPARIDRILAKLGAYWRACPDLRLGQIVSNLTAERGFVFYVEDDVIEAAIDRADTSSYVHAPAHSIYECRCCSASTGDVPIPPSGQPVAPGWGRIVGIDGPDSICPACIADPTALDGWRDEYPDVAVKP